MMYADIRYSEVLNYLYTRLPMYQRTGVSAYKNSLENTHALDVMFGHPHKQFNTIHVAGTNGKGSVSHMLASVLQEAGYNTGLYTSPHLVDFRERIKVNGEIISENDVVSFVDRFIGYNANAGIEPSFFELTVAMAFDHFRARQVDVAVIEVGLGGRLDSTNIITPEVAVITNISLDHVGLLGKTIDAIAVEKAGIIKAGVPVVISESNPEYDHVFLQKASELGSTLYFADHEDCCAAFPGLKTDLLGNYQSKNAVGVLKALELLRHKGWHVSRENVYDGIQQVRLNTGLRGRWEITGRYPLVICDTGHNEAGIRMVACQLKQMKFEKLHVVFGTVDDKDVSAVFALLPKKAHYYFTQASIPRALNSHVLRERAAAAGLPGRAFNTVGEAVDSAMRAASSHDLVFIGGSTFVVADYLQLLPSGQQFVGGDWQYL